ncbi:ATP-binding cassette domain-containing protein [Streptomyces lunaelactis]|uniref:ATP-binding cassette domain-containing protein n=1 Tax=Streptomyces lunaelactis TaxID=1535768 RepID=UPI00158453E5|nr:ATP-binding cassette domain-containing protein [Streptomyces lunaelactis]NUK54098.1 ATP-binding cassette domain-containing protein [Streptomyces lunaelactis]NUK66771.1 ATP-binding cassette domain-containing protein [Streptomyces lunaelactis]
MNYILRATGLSQRLGRKDVLSSIDLNLSPGVLGLLGPNGAGKTTLLKTLATVLPPAQGELAIHGTAIHSERSARAARRHIGFLPQDFGYYPNFKVRDFVLYCAWLRGVPKSQARSAADEAITRVDLTERSRDKLKQLSGGMLRRVGIAAATVGSPELVLLDEPTVGLDPGQRLGFRELVRGMRSSAVVLSTHLVEDVAAVCDEIAVLRCGSIVFRGTPDELEQRARPGVPGDSPLEQGYMAVLSSRVHELNVA